MPTYNGRHFCKGVASRVKYLSVNLTGCLVYTSGILEDINFHVYFCICTHYRIISVKMYELEFNVFSTVCIVKNDVQVKKETQT